MLPVIAERTMTLGLSGSVRATSWQRICRGEAYMIATVAVDYHITQVVDGVKGVHGMIPKAIFITP